MKPQTTLQGLIFFPIPDFGFTDCVFGASESMYFNRNNLPVVPTEFENMAQGLFFRGGEVTKFSAKVDRNKALMAIAAWLGSFAPAHEAKIATVAYALWLWTDDAALPEVPSDEPKKSSEPKTSAKKAKTPRGTARAQRRHFVK